MTAHRELCQHCGGRGTVLAKDAETRARQGGNASYVKSLQPGEKSMAERGRGTLEKPGGAPRLPRIEDVAHRRRGRSRTAGGAGNLTRQPRAPGRTRLGWRQLDTLEEA